MPSWLLGLVMAVLVTGAIFGGGWLLLQVIIPAVGRGEALPMLRWAAIAIIGAILVYRLFGRYHRRKGARGDFE